MTTADLPGAAHLMLVDEVSYLDPASAVFEAMLEGWARQQRTRGLAAATVRGRLTLVRRLYEFSNLYPWQWTCSELEAFFDGFRSGERPLALSTLRCYQVSLRLFVEFVCDSRYGWPGCVSSGSAGRRWRYCTSGTRWCMPRTSRAGRGGVR